MEMTSSHGEFYIGKLNEPLRTKELSAILELFSYYFMIFQSFFFHIYNSNFVFSSLILFFLYYSVKEKPVIREIWNFYQSCLNEGKYSKYYQLHDKNQFVSHQSRVNFISFLHGNIKNNMIQVL